MTFSGDFPHGKHGSYKPYRVEITVNEDRPSWDIAKEIERRLLPRYLKALNGAHEAKNRDEGRDAQRLYRYAEITAALGAGELLNQGTNYPEIRVYRHSDNGACAEPLRGQEF